MLSTLRAVCVSLLISQVISKKTLCQQTDLLTCYAKESLVCQKEGNGINTKYWRSQLTGGNKDTVNMASGSSSFYRPRSAMARALYEKQNSDRYLQEFDKNEVCTAKHKQTHGCYSQVH